MLTERRKGRDTDRRDRKKEIYTVYMLQIDTPPCRWYSLPSRRRTSCLVGFCTLEEREEILSKCIRGRTETRDQQACSFLHGRFIVQLVDTIVLAHHNAYIYIVTHGWLSFDFSQSRLKDRWETIRGNTDWNEMLLEGEPSAIDLQMCSVHLSRSDKKIKKHG